ncbi:MAG: hypothetical protein ACYC4U_07525 [Pirellulaceae bacterium]
MPTERSSNPYVAPDSFDVCRLSRRDRTILEFHLRHRDRPPSLAFLLSQYVSLWFGVLVSFATILGAVTFLFGHLAVGVAFVGGVLFATVARDIGHSRQIIHRWPLLVSVLDWDKIDRLLQGSKSA